MADIMRLADYVLQKGEEGRQQGQASRLARLAGMAYAAPADQQREYVQQAVQVDPRSGFALADSLGGDRAERMKGLSQKARLLVGYHRAGNSQYVNSLYPQIAQEAQSLGLGQGIPTQWNDSFLAGMEQLAELGGGPQGIGVQSTYVDANGNRVAIMRDGSTAILGQNAPQNQIIDTGAGFYGVNRGNLQAAPVMIGGRPGIAPAGIGAGGMPYRIDPGLPPEAQALAEADAANGGASNAYTVQGSMPAQLRSAPKPGAPSDIERRLQLADQYGATPEEKRRMVIGREGAAAGAKPLPVGALNQLMQVEDALGATANVSAIIKKHADRMKNGELVVGPVDSLGAMARTKLGITNANDVNLNEWRSDLTRIVNESLRLNKGVQTEGDAQRAANELMTATDQQTASRALRRLAEFNQRAIELQKRKRETIRKNYGQDANGDPLGTQQEQQAGGWSIQRVD